MTNELSTDELAQMRERAENATPGPWEARGFDSRSSREERANAEFIANARTDIPRLLDALQAERIEVERLRRWKAEALQVLAGWETVWEALGMPGDLGQQKSSAALAEVKRLRLNLASVSQVANDYNDEIVAAHADRDRWKAFGEGVLDLVRRSQNDPHFAVVNIAAAGYVGSVIRASDILALANEHNLLND